MEAVKELIGHAITIASERKEDVKKGKGNVATTDVKGMINLEKAIINTFGCSSKEIISSGNLEVILDTAAAMLVPVQSVQTK